MEGDEYYNTFEEKIFTAWRLSVNLFMVAKQREQDW